MSDFIGDLKCELGKTFFLRFQYFTILVDRSWSCMPQIGLTLQFVINQI